MDENGQIDSTKVSGLATAPNPASTFQAAACASLSETNDSGFTISGVKSGSVGAPVESQAVGTCPTATAPATT